jgi:hypothetical protein
VEGEGYFSVSYPLFKHPKNKYQLSETSTVLKKKMNLFGDKAAEYIQAFLLLGSMLNLNKN